jgi:ribonuclease HIII
LDTREQAAIKIIDRYSQILNKQKLFVSDPVKNEYSYQVMVSGNDEKISLNVFFGKKGNKIVLQGNKDLKLFKRVSDIIFGEKLINEFKPESEPAYPYIGTDESGKGDYFGPLVIAGVYVTSETGNYLRSLGVRDSKELSDYQIKNLASEIKNRRNILFDVVLISPEKYNQLYDKMGNLNRLMGWAHARVIENLLNKCDAGEVISDKFGNEKLIVDALQQKGREINLKQITKAEKFTAVAAASILAREGVIDWFQNQSSKLKIIIPKGSSEEVERSAKKIVEEYGEKTLNKLVKLHFKTSRKIFSN